MATNEHIMKEILAMRSRMYPQSEDFRSVKGRWSEKYSPQEIGWKFVIAKLQGKSWIERTKWPFIKTTPEGKDALGRMFKEQRQGYDAGSGDGAVRPRELSTRSFGYWEKQGRPDMTRGLRLASLPECFREFLDFDGTHPKRDLSFLFQTRESLCCRSLKYRFLRYMATVLSRSIVILRRIIVSDCRQIFGGLVRVREVDRISIYGKIRTVGFRFNG